MVAGRLWQRGAEEVCGQWGVRADRHGARAAVGLLMVDEEDERSARRVEQLGGLRGARVQRGEVERRELLVHVPQRARRRPHPLGRRRGTLKRLHA